MSTFACPECSEQVPAGAGSCQACALPLVGPAASRLWQVDRQLADLRAERTRLLRDLRLGGSSGAGARPAPEDAGVVTPSGDGRVKSSGRGVQQLLLGTGAVLVLVASLVFLAVAWSVAGVFGQAAILLGLTAVAAFGSSRLAGRGLRSSAEALAVIATGLLAQDLHGARSLDMAGLGSVDGAWYAAAACGAGTVVLAALTLRCAPLRTYPNAATLAAALVPLAVLDAAGAGELTVGAALLAVAVTFTLAADRAVGRWAAARKVARVVAGSAAAISCSLAVLGSFVGALPGHPRVDDEPSAFGALALAAAAAGLLVARALYLPRPSRGTGADDAGASVRGATLAAVLPGSWTGALPAGAGALASGAVVATLAVVGVAAHSDVTLAALVLLAAAAAAVSSTVRVSCSALVAVVSYLVAGVGLTTLACRRDMLNSGASDLVLGYVIAAVAAAAAVTALCRRPVRAAMATVAAAGALAATGELLRGQDRSWLCAALVVVALVGAGLAAARAGRGEEVPLAVVAGAGLMLAAAAAADAGAAMTLAGVLAVTGLAALTYALLPSRGLVAVAGVLACSSSTWVLLGDHHVRTVEAYTLPLAALAAVVGLVRLRRQPQSPSWATVGPAVSAALLPSAVTALGDPGLLRPVLVLAAAVVVIAAGVRFRWQAPVVTGAVAALVIAASQLGPWAVGLPRWLSLGTAGVLLLVIGIRYERAHAAAGRARRWVTSLR